MNPAQPKIWRAGTLTYTRRSLALLCLWLLWGDFCFVLMETVVPSLMPLKFKALGASNTGMGLMIGTIPNLIATVMTPIVSFRSDRHRSRWGRRIPFIAGTLPLLVLCLIGLGFGDRLGFALRGHFAGLLGRFSPETVAIAVLGVMMTLFSFFNSFVNSVFWYLFNDVVPEKLLARFMSWFRVVSLGAGAVYNLFVLRHAGAHTAEIFAGASLLYLGGFGLMCLKVREGSYPPPPPLAGGRRGVIGVVDTYRRECLGLAHYWFVFLAMMGVAMSYATGVFVIFFYQSLGLTLEQFGRVTFVASTAAALMNSVTGWLADRYHPIRIAIAGAVVQTIVAPVNLMWLWWHPDAGTVYHVLLALQIGLFAPTNALLATIDPPLFMRIFPRERYGQFCSANAMLRSIVAIVAGALLGACLDGIAAHWGPKVAYGCLPGWNALAYAVVLFALLKLYRSWQRHGGDRAYQPPLPSESSSPAAAAGEHQTSASPAILSPD
jgi:MFS family permease